MLLFMAMARGANDGTCFLLVRGPSKAWVERPGSTARNSAFNSLVVLLMNLPCGVFLFVVIPGVFEASSRSCGRVMFWRRVGSILGAVLAEPGTPSENGSPPSRRNLIQRFAASTRDELATWLMAEATKLRSASASVRQALTGPSTVMNSPSLLNWKRALHFFFSRLWRTCPICLPEAGHLALAMRNVAGQKGNCKQC